MSYSSEVLADSPLVYLTLDDASGTSAVDSSGNSRNMTSANCTLSQATVMPAGTSSYGFNGTSSQVSLADAVWQRPSPAFTVEAWIKPNQVDFRAIAAKDGPGTGWALYISSGKLAMYVNGTARADTTTTLSTGTVYHVAATVNATAIILYVNGAQVASFAGTTVTGEQNTSLMVGVSTGSNAGVSRFFWFDGKLDEFAFYGSVLTGTRIAAHYTAGNAASSAATGTGSLTLSGSGAGSAAAVGSGSLTLSGSGAGRAVAAGSGSLSLSAQGAVDFLPAVGAGSLSLSGSGAAGVGVTGTGSLSLSGSATAAGSTAATGAGSLSLSGSGAGGIGVTATGSLSLSATGAAAVLYATDTTNALDGLSLVGVATVTVTRAPATPPATLVVADRFDKAVPYPVPTMVNGRPT